MRGTYDRTSVSPTTGNSGSFMAYKQSGKRPIGSICETLDSCPTCPADRPFKFPVVPGDAVYMQFRFEDLYNTNPLDPEYGWYTGPSGDFWLEAFLEFGTIDDLALPFGNIIVSQSTGWADGSYQNIVLNSNAINGYALTQGAEDECFRLRVNTYRYTGEEVTTVIIIGVLPDAATLRNGLYAVNGTDIYITVDGEWVLDHAAVDGELVFNMASGQYQRYDSDSISKPWPISERAQERTLYQTCYSYWHKIIPDCLDTVLIRGVFQTNDCAGHYYGSFDGAVPFIDQYRLEVSLEMTAIITDKETNENDIVTSLKQYENWLLRNHVSLPEGVIRRLANSLEADRVYLNTNEYVNASDVTKLNESGENWYIAPTIQRVLCERENNCNDNFAFNPLITCAEFQECPDPGSPVTVRNSDSSYDVEVPSGETLVLADQTINVYFEGVLIDSQTYPALTNPTINIIWN